ncbi:C-type lectin domain family 14 member A [Fukomys damarensis]|uniref:C-type lectin domain family 14 member A n=1 Tax=Fukomys damarensis TaxID=885580 RepID=UPI00053FE999|nr:C-type lectin domain family 14 member A [Fukomys damarensis]
MRPALALCLLCQALWPGPGDAEHPTTVHGGAELRAVLALLRAGPGPGGGSKDLVFWVALERGRSHCTLESEPLRGFSWLTPDAGASENDTLPWVEEPQRSCTVRKCAGLQATRGAEPAGWKEMRCHLRANGYLCKYQFENLCPAPRPGAASNLNYRAPFQLHSSALDFSPPGTKVSATCPGERSVAATCVEEETGARWDELPSGAVLCPCPGGYLRAGRCAELSHCLEGLEHFACECAEGFQLGKDGRSCVTKREGQPSPGATKVPTWSQGATAASPTVQEKPGERPPNVTGQGSSSASVVVLQWGPRSTISSLQISPDAEPTARLTPWGSMIPTFNSTPASSRPQSFDFSSTVVSILVSIAVLVLVILTLTVLGLFKLCFHKSPSSERRKGSLAPRGVESEAERCSSAHFADLGAKARDRGVQGRAEDSSLAGSSLASWGT